jgi:hypothetical protein
VFYIFQDADFVYVSHWGEHAITKYSKTTGAKLTPFREGIEKPWGIRLLASSRQKGHEF